MKQRLVLWNVVATLALTLTARANAQTLTLASTQALATPLKTTAATAAQSAAASSLAFPIDISWFLPTWKCVHANGAVCASSELTNGWYKQVFITSTGFAESERGDFWNEFNKVVSGLTSAGNAWSTQQRDRILFIGYFVPGGPIGSSTAAFDGQIPQHPIRGYATSLTQQKVYDKIAQIAATDIPGLRPFTAGVLFNSFQQGVTANAAPPGFVSRAFGVAKFTRQDLVERPAYITSHELAHAGLNFLDEYVESGFENFNIRTLDVLTPLALFDGSWGGFVNAISDMLSVYDYNISEIVAANGNDNVTLSPWPSTVYTPGYSGEYYAYQHGMFFGLGTYHMAGKNLMNGSALSRGADDGFDYAHSPDQQRVVNTAFWGGTGRPNDRIRNAGPKNGWPLVFGSQTHVMLYDGDKNHHFQPTRSYTVQVGWYDRQWHTCWAAIVPYPCYNDVWTTAQTSVAPQPRQINLSTSSLYWLANLAQGALCAVGYTEIPTGSGSSFKLCTQDLSTVATNFLPTMSFPSPYQDVTVPASQWLTTYWWRFQTYNGGWTSGWTGWSSFYRSL